jgi:hypothetical protein
VPERGGRHARRALHLVRAVAADALHAVRRRRSPDGWTTASPNRVHLVPPAAVTHVLAARLPEPLRGRRHGGDWE